MEAFANLMAQQIASTTGNQFVVLVSRADSTDCHSVNEGRASDYDDAYYVLTFSEQSRSVCLTVDGALPKDSKAPGITLSPGSARSFGREFTTAVRVVPMHRSLTRLSPEYLALLHWRAKVDPNANVRAGAAQRVTSPSAQISFIDTSLNFADIRAEVAKRHDFVNQVLLVLGLASGALALAFLGRVKSLYDRSVPLFERYEYQLTAKVFLIHDLGIIGSDAECEYNHKRQESLAAARLEHILQREKEEATRRLQSLLAQTQGDAKRLRIQAALDSGEVNDMESIIEELQPHLAERTPEERLHLLLEPLKEYAAEDEIREVETEALRELQQHGFRGARETVIRLHNQFRARYKALQEATAPNEPN